MNQESSLRFPNLHHHASVNDSRAISKCGKPWSLFLSGTPQKDTPENVPQGRIASIPNVMAKLCRIARIPHLTSFLLLATAATADTTLKAEASASKEQFTPLAEIELTELSDQVRRQMLAGNLQQVIEILRENPTEPTTMIFATAIDLAGTDVIDPLANIGHDHDFIETAGAFIPNGNPHPTEYFSREFKSLAETDPEMAPVIADAICNVIALQLLQAVEQDAPIALSDDILFSKEDTSAERVLFETTLREVLCSTPESRKHFHELRRLMWLQKVSDANGVPFFSGGPWIALRRLAAEMDPGSVARWRPVFAKVAVDCGKRGRFTSGSFVVVHGCGDRIDGALGYLLEESKDDLTDERRVTNFKIAFGYLGEAARMAGLPFPPRDDATFDQVQKIVETSGDPKQTTIAFEAAFGKQ
jgi:hypothetical protein